MKFCEQLNEYMENLGCTAKELCGQSGVSAATMSRYRSGERVPEGGSELLLSLCDAIAEQSKEGDNPLSREKVFEAFSACSDIMTVDKELLLDNFNALVSSLSLGISALCPYINYDPSTVSRFRNHSRQPADPLKFADGVAEFLRQNITDEQREKAAVLYGCEAEELKSENAVFEQTRSFLLFNRGKKQKAVSDFLSRLDEFDLNEYIKVIKFDEIKIPTLPFQLPTSKKYFGLKAMMDSELDFLKATVLSKSDESVIMYSDMPMGEMAKDSEFPKKWMFGMAMMLKKGLCLKQIHNLDRSFEDMMLGLESWIPMYMTGQISPYYFENADSGVFLHLLKVSGAAALSGEAINGFHSDGKYYLTKSKDELVYFKKRAEQMLSRARPLMDIYRADREEEYSSFKSFEAEKGGNERNILAALPIYVLNSELLREILESNNVSGEDFEKVFGFFEKSVRRFEKILEKGSVTDEILSISKDDISARPLSLDLSEMFFDKNITLTRKQYSAAIINAERLSRENENYNLKLCEEQAFRNLQIHIKEVEWAAVSKCNPPAVHFVIRHPKLRAAIESFEPALKD